MKAVDRCLPGLIIEIMPLNERYYQTSRDKCCNEVIESIIAVSWFLWRVDSYGS